MSYGNRPGLFYEHAFTVVYLPRSTWLRANWCNSNESANELYSQMIHRAVYVDRYYSSVQLTQQLNSNKTYICGTFHSDLKDNPKEVTKKKLQRGKMIWRRAGTVSVFK